jgi:hypothetical protein
MPASSAAAELDDDDSATTRAEHGAGAARLSSAVRPLRKDGELVKRLARHGAAIGHDAHAGLAPSEGPCMVGARPRERVLASMQRAHSCCRCSLSTADADSSS